MIQFNKNSFGLAPGTQNVPVPQLAPGSTQTAVLPLVQNPALVSPTAASSLLQVLPAILQLDLTTSWPTGYTARLADGRVTSSALC